MQDRSIASDSVAPGRRERKKNHGSKSRFVPPISGERKRGNKREREREREQERERERGNKREH